MEEHESLKVAGTESDAPSATLVVSFTAIVIYFIIQCDPGQMKTPDFHNNMLFLSHLSRFQLTKQSNHIYKNNKNEHNAFYVAVLESKLKHNFSSKFLEDLEIEPSSVLN